MIYEVVVRHDTTMWNEGFEHAREPYVVVPVTSDEGAKAVADWVNTTYALRNLPLGDDDKAFTAEVRLSASKAAPMTTPAARALVKARIAEWLGL